MNEPIPVTQTPRALDTIISGGPTIADAYIVADGDDWLLSTTGPNDAGLDDDSGDFDINGALTEHVRFFRRINSDWYWK